MHRDDNDNEKTGAPSNKPQEVAPSSANPSPYRLEADGDRDATSPDANVSRRSFLGGAAVGGAAAAGFGLGFVGGDAAAHKDKHGHGNEDWHHHHDDKDDKDDKNGPPKLGKKDRLLLKDGIVLSMDPAVGDFVRADVLIEGKKILAVGPNIGPAPRSSTARA